MYVILPKNEEIPLIGRPKREDKTTRANFKLNVNIRKLLKNRAERNNRSESAQVEQFVKEFEAIDMVLQEYPEIAALFYPKFNEKLAKVNDELTGQTDSDQ